MSLQGIKALASARDRLAVRGFGIFLAVGLIGLLADAAVFMALNAGGMALAAARAVSISVATLVTWQLNRRFTFRASGRRRLDEALRYAGVALLAQGGNYLGFILLCHLAPAVPPLLILLTCSAGVAGISFLGQRVFTFGQR